MMPILKKALRPTAWLLLVTLLLSCFSGCTPTMKPDSSDIQPVQSDNLITEGQAKGFVRLSSEDKAFYGAIEKLSLFVPETQYSNEDKTVCLANVVQYGAVGDGVTDDTNAFRQAVSAVQGNGGGTVFVPEGAYYITEALTLPSNVLLRGEYDTPTISGYGGGTTILTDYAATGYYNGGFITHSSASGLRNLAIYYLNQNFAEPLDLIPCISIDSSGAVGTTVENVMIYNASYPMMYGHPGGNSCHEFNNIWATPLKIGFLTDNNGDVTNFVNMYMDAKYYAECGFAGAPQNDEERQQLYTTLKDAVAYIFERHDTPYANSLYSHSIGTGMIVRESSHPNRQTWANSGGFAGSCSLYNFEFTGCHTGIRLENVLLGSSFTKGRIRLAEDPTAVGIQITDAFNANLTVEGVVFEGTPGRVVDNHCKDGNLQFSNCSFGNWSEHGVVSDSGHLYLTNCHFGKSGGEIKADGSAALGVQGCTFAGTPEISAIGITEGNYRLAPEKLTEMMAAPEVEYDFLKKKPSAAKYQVYNAGDYGLDNLGEDDASEAINKALKEAGDNGGGIVYVPAGEYRLDKPLYVPEGVELRGPLENFHTNNFSSGSDAIFYVYFGADQNEGDGAVVLAKKSGVMGLSFYYPDQNVYGYRKGEEYTPYPYTITAKGPGCWVYFTVCVNSYQMLDFGSAPDTSDYVIYGVRGQPLKVGVFGGNNSGTGRVERCNFSLAEWCYGSLPYRVYFGSGTYDAAGMSQNAEWNAYVMGLLENSDYYKFGYNKNLLVYGNLAYSTRYGLRFVEQGDKYTENAEIFYHCTDVCASTTNIEKAGNLFMFGSFSDCEMATDCGAVVSSYNTGMNTVFDHAMNVHGGILNISGLGLRKGYPVFLNVTGGTVNFSGGIVSAASDVFIRASGNSKVSINGLVFRKRRGLLNDVDLFVTEISGNAAVTPNCIFGTNKN